MTTTSADSKTLDVPVTEISRQLERIESSPELGNSKRLIDALRFIITEVLEGRGRKLKGATIGHAVFDKSGNFDPDSNSIVRVEMGRLRSRLTEYYAGTGQGDPVIITIPKGTYVPEFKTADDVGQSTNADTAKPGFDFRPGQVVLLLAGLLMVISALLYWFSSGEKNLAEVAETGQVSLKFQASNPEAQALFQQAFVLLMPPEDDTRLESSINLFDRVVELDSEFPGGYSGKSIALLFRVFFLKSDDPETDLDLATALAEQAVATGAGFSLGHAALALAFSMSGEAARARDSAQATIAIRPPDPNAYAIASLGLTVAGNPTQAIELLTKAIELNPDQPRTPYLNLLGAAYFVKEEYENAARSFEKNLDSGGPSGPHISLFLAASYAYLDRDFEARSILVDIAATYPEFSTSAWFGNFIHSESRLREILSKLSALGEQVE